MATMGSGAAPASIASAAQAAPQEIQVYDSLGGDNSFGALLEKLSWGKS